LTNASSWEKVQFWIDELVANEENCDIYIVGTKGMHYSLSRAEPSCSRLAADRLEEEGVQRAMPEATIDDFAQQHNADVFETSAKTGQNINDLFYKIARDFLKKKKNAPIKAYEPVAIMNNPDTGKKTGCCG
jgi:Ras-related protein Rab-24